jgi:hypothetical protein
LDEIRGEVTTVEESTLIEAIVLFFSANLLLSLTTLQRRLWHPQLGHAADMSRWR